MPPAAEARAAGSTRSTPLWLIAIAVILLALRIGAGIYEAKNGRIEPVENPAFQIRR